MTSSATPFAFLTDDPARLEKFLVGAGAGVRVDGVVKLTGQGLFVRDAKGTETLWREPDMACAGLIAFDAALAQRIAAWWLERSGEPLAVFQPAGRAVEQRASLMAWMAGRSFELAGSVAQQAAGVASQNRQLRRSYTALQRNFAKLESFIAAQNLDMRMLHVPGDAPDAWWVPAKAGEALRQTLPAMQGDCAAISLYLEVPERTGAARRKLAKQAMLHVRLIGEPEGREIASWEVAFSNIRDGANIFELPGHIDTGNELLIEITWSALELAPRIALSPPHWNAPYFVDEPQLRAERRSLCAEIWSGPAGARRPQRLDGATLQPLGNRRAPDVFGPAIILQAHEHSYPGAPMRSHPLVQISGQRLVVHPATQQPTIAVLPRRVPLGTTAMRIDCRTLHHQASAIEYCMAVCADLKGIADVLQQPKADSACFSGWKRLRAGDKAILTLEFEAPVSSALKICLATRLPFGSQEAYAWASFGDALFFRGDYTLEDYLRDGEYQSDEEAAGDDTHEAADPQVIYAQTNFSQGFSAGLQDKGADFRRDDLASSIALSADEFFTATLLAHAQTQHYGEDSVFAVDRDWLLVHPHGPAPTIAVIQSVLPSGVRRMSVMCQTIESQAGEIEYAAAIVPRGAEPFDFIQAQEKACPGFSGWIALPPLQKAGISLQLQMPSKGDETICLATRLAPGATDAHCWSCFGELMFHFDDGKADGPRSPAAGSRASPLAAAPT